MGRLWAVVLASGFGSAVWAGGPPEGITLEMSVVSMADLKPIRGAELVVERVHLGAAAAVPSEDADSLLITRVNSNERGEIVLRELPLIPLRLKLEAEGYVSPQIEDLREIQSRHRLELRLPPAIDVTGTVVDDSGQPVPNVQVDLPYAMDMNRRAFPLSESLSATTDAAGFFRIKRAPEGLGRFHVSASGYSLSKEEGTQALSLKPVKLTVRRTGILRVDIDAPLHLRGQYVIKIEKVNEHAVPKQIDEKPSADRGSISFIDVPAGRYLVSATIPPRRASSVVLLSIVDVEVGQTTDVRLPAKR